MITLHQGDCLDIMPQFVPDESVDLIYLDPPFYTGHNFDTFMDKWLSMDTYVKWLRMRLWECHRVLKPTGSIYCHLDWHAVHYVKVMMDEIFGYDNFRNDITWCYSRPSAPKQKQLSRCHDTILWYAKGDTWVFNGDDIRIPYAQSSLDRAGYGAKASKMAGGVGKDAKVELKKGGKLPEDWWNIPMLKGNSKERLGYPTQKPEALLERIIKVSSNPGDLVLDPFCGCGTALAVAQKLGRRWIGIDLSDEAITISQRRLSSCQKHL